MKALVSIITVNYNGLRDTCEMIDSFRSRETYPRYEIIVVDNGSRLPEAEEIQDRYRDNPVPGGSLSGSPAADNPISSHPLSANPAPDTPGSFPPVKVVRNINNGFAGGNNAGLKAAAGDYLFFINNDTLIKEPVLDALVRRIESDSPRNGGVSPMLKFAARPDTLQYAGFTPLSPVTLRNAAIGFMQQDSPRFRIPRETASLHGAAMMVSRRALQDAGTMSEVYFLFYEELDWSAQLRKAGYRLWYEPAAVVYHKEGMTARRGSPTREFYLSRARMLFARRNLRGIGKYLSCAYLCILAAPKKAAVYLLHGQIALAKATICGTCEGIYKNIRTA